MVLDRSSGATARYARCYLCVGICCESKERGGKSTRCPLNTGVSGFYFVFSLVEKEHRQIVPLPYHMTKRK